MKKTVPCIIAAIFCLSVNAIAQTIYFSENFSSVTPPALPAGWSSTYTAVPGTTPQGWVSTSFSTDYLFHYTPSPTSQYVECTEDYYPGNDPAYMTSPIFSLAGAVSPYLEFEYVFNGYSTTTGGITCTEKAWIQISTNGGYSWTTIDSLPAWGYWKTRFINLSAYDGYPYVMLNFLYTDNGGTSGLTGELLANIRVFDAADTDIALTAITPAPGTYFVIPATGTTLGGVITNLTTSVIDTFSATCQVGSGTPIVATFSGIGLAPMSTYSFVFPGIYHPSFYNTQPVKMWVTTPGDTIHSDDTLVSSITGISHYPVNKLVAEEACGTWCDECPAGIIYMDSLENLIHGAMSFIAVHNSLTTTDPMTMIGVYPAWIASHISYYPTVLVDRNWRGDPSMLQNTYNTEDTDFAYADISMHASVIGDTQLTATVSVSPATDLYGPHPLALVLTEDSVHSNDTVPYMGWNQANIFSGGGGAMADAEYNFSLLPNPVPATLMYYNHVARAYYPPFGPTTYGGDYLPDTMLAGSTYSYTFSVPIGTGVVVQRMHAIAILVDSATTYILNSDNIKLDTVPGVPHLPVGPLHTPDVAAAAGQITMYPNPATNTVTITSTDNIRSIAVTDLLGQTIFTGSYDAPKVRIDVSGMAPGVYFIRINGTAVREFIRQ